MPDELTDEGLEARLFPPPLAIPGEQRPKPDWAAIHRELKRPGVTLLLLGQEHRARLCRNGHAGPELLAHGLDVLLCELFGARGVAAAVVRDPARDVPLAAVPAE